MKRFLRGNGAKAAAFILILVFTVISMALMGDIIDRGESLHDVFVDDFDDSVEMGKIRHDLRMAIHQDSVKEMKDYLNSLGYANYTLATGGVQSVDIDTVKDLPWWFHVKVKPAKAEDEPPAEDNPPAVDNAPSVDNTTAVDNTPTENDAPSGTEAPAGNAALAENNTPDEDADAIPEGSQLITTEDGTYVFAVSPDGIVTEVQPTVPSGDNTNTAVEELWDYSYEDSDGDYYQYGSDYMGAFELYAGVSKDYYYDRMAVMKRSKNQVVTDIYIMIGLFLAALGLWIYLLKVSGRKKDDDEIHMLAIDRIFVEITIGATAAGAILLAIASFGCLVELPYGGALDIFMPLAMLSSAAASALLVLGSASVARNIKNHTFAGRSLFARLTKWLKKSAAWYVKWFKKAAAYLCGDKVSVIVLAAFILYTLLITTICHHTVLIVLLASAACIFAYRFLSQLDKLRDGITHIYNGDTDHRVEGCTAPVLAGAADELNNIGNSVKESVKRELSAQMMKTRLITNVSHDLKTPLTSIISYADILSNMELTPPEANDYVKIIKQKGERLKKLTQDLFDISKAESGSETVNLENLDAGLLLRQSLAELNSEIEKSSLTFVTSIPEKEVFVLADGKKLSRVFENLIINALKYSMPGTRVYVSLTDAPPVTAEIKNISAEPMNFSPAEITERFVRGDSSRTTEGSGLGLAIAKSYAELCGGSLDIRIDGDLFKVRVRLTE